MNRYALEMYAREKQQNSVSMSTIRPLFGFLSRSRARVLDYQSEPPTNDSMTFIYGLRCDLVNLDLDEALPISK
jgi:hypothetical protein